MPGRASQRIDRGDTVRKVQLCYSSLHHVAVEMDSVITRRLDSLLKRNLSDTALPLSVVLFSMLGTQSNSYIHKYLGENK